MKRSKLPTADGARAAGEPARDAGPGKAKVAGPGVPPVVALGASAGGLETLTRFIEAVPPDSGMAFVLIQHLDPEHESLMAELIGTHTVMNVALAGDGKPVEPNHVYVIPPKAVLTIADGKLHLEPQRERAFGRMPIDTFFESLARDQREKAIGIILTGTGTDGTLGLKAIKEQGGLVIAQEPMEAPHGGMPQSAMATGMVDLVLPVVEMPKALKSYIRQHYYRAGSIPATFGDKARDILPAILDFLKDHSSIDFDLYREGTLLRRIERRMGLKQIESGEAYLKYLRKNSREIEELCRDLLISVTSFFRDTEVFRHLETEILPEIVRRHSVDEPIRAWVAGCATGEEAYSLAVLLAEQVATTGRRRRVQIFASDVDEQALTIARAGLYPESIEAEVSRERLTRFFSKEDHSYRVQPELREMIVFAIHNLLTEAPFSRLDLVLCRNVLIYLNPEVQKRIIALFQFALRKDGILLLGKSETIGDRSDLFQQVSRKHRSYRRIGPAGPARIHLPVARAQRRPVDAAPEKEPFRSRHSLAELTRRLLIEHFAPAAVLVNTSSEGLYFSGPVDAYLRVPAGEASRDLITMLRDGLRAPVRRAIAEALKTGESAVVQNAVVVRAGARRPVAITVDPVDADPARLLLVTFDDERESAHDVGGSQAEPAVATTYEDELQATRRELQSTIWDLEQANEELRAANEEAMSMNEEFQSTNEELETSKEELQSLNEELTTLNNQLQEKVKEQQLTANDLENLLTSSDIATVFLDERMQVKRFTSAAAALFNLLSNDVGRPLTDIKWKIDDPSLIDDARQVLKTLSTRQRELETDDGRWFTRRILPYRTCADTIEGVVITLGEISVQKAAQHQAQIAHAFYESIFETVREPLIVLDRDLQIVMANRAFSAAFTTSADAATGRSIFEIEDGRWDLPPLRKLLNKVIAANSTVEDYEVEADFKGLGRRKLLLNARCVRANEEAPVHLLLALLDVTESERRREALEEHTLRLSSILSSLPAAVINIDEQGTIASFSPGAERIFGYSAEEVAGRNIRMLMPEPDHSRHDGLPAAFRETGTKNTIGRGREVTGRRKDGSTVPLMLNVTETKIGKFRVFTGALRDLTEQKHTEDELRQARKMEVMGRLVGGVAHDFNNLLTIISGNLELLARHIDAADDRERISTALDAAELAANLTSQMLVFARRRELTPARVDVNALIPEMIEMIRRMLDERIHVSMKIGKDVHDVYADEATLRAALLNLAVNARDAMPDDGQLTVKAMNVRKGSIRDKARAITSADELVSISVSDTGLGMTPDLLKRASEPFFTTKDVGKGSGLGLSMVYGFAKQSGGWIEMESMPGRGTTVTMLLPAMKEKAQALMPSGSTSEPEIVPRGKERVLLVEDDPRVREATVKRLEILGYTVLEAENGPAALDLLAKGEPFDLLLTDVVMPHGMSGSDLALEMRGRRPDLPVLFTSGYAPFELALEPDDVLLEKPYRIDLLARKIRKALDG